VIKIDGALWVRALSARYGRCLLTGDPVRTGDRVYVPQKTGRHRWQRILASAVEERLGMVARAATAGLAAPCRPACGPGPEWLEVRRVQITQAGRQALGKG
jgi:hypothetical protein